jgi:hypothetical protein
MTLDTGLVKAYNCLRLILHRMTTRSNVPVIAPGATPARHGVQVRTLPGEFPGSHSLQSNRPIRLWDR